ncbi:hypothetical protein MLD38_024804 [Melastoma candidum]|uniref:Uncharacterized protein n=1 Tax=Melastoma candidum TaxID=119954 RepID=A0ACB9NWH0_9MYRT|nr:hypothetical protein MLD38_024804 [Melastoma candidum]
MPPRAHRDAKFLVLKADASSSAAAGHHVSSMSEGAYNSREMHPSEGIPRSPIASETVKARPAKRPKEAKGAPAPKKAPKQPKKVKRESDDLNKILIGSDNFAKPVKSDWKVQDLGLNQVLFDETTMPPPCALALNSKAVLQGGGSGGWQSSCCTTTHLYPGLAAEGQDLSNPVDLRDHWAKQEQTGTSRSSRRQSNFLLLVK